MASPSKNLVECIPHDIILQELGSSVKSLPTVAQCPVNSEHKFTLHPDDGSIWGSCGECGFSGDSVDILQAKFRNLSVESVITRLEKDGLIKDVSRELIMAYQLYRVKRNSWSKFLDDARKDLCNYGFDMRVLDAFGAPPPFKREWQEGFGKFVGRASRAALADMLNSSMTQIHRDMLILPYYDMPGRIANIRLVSYNKRGLAYSDKATNRSGGLFMLDSVSPSPEYVIAVDDPILACQIQMRRMESSLVNLPIVAWHPDTKYWPISPKRTVFWAPDPTVAMYRQARLVPGAYVCAQRNNINFESLLRERDAKSWVHHVMVDSQPWALALKNTLLSMSELGAIKFAKELEITPLETGEILFECDSDEKARLVDVLDLRLSVRNIMSGDSKIVERDNAWWTYTEKGRIVRVCNAPFAITKSAHYADKGSYLMGAVTVDGRSEQFMAPADTFMLSPTKWLRKFALRNGMGLVHTLPGWDAKLLDVSTKFNNEKIVHVDRKAVVGWSDSMDSFSFPKLCLINGKVDECDIGMPTDGMPCTKVTGHPTQRSVWSEFMKHTPANRVFWSVLSCISVNMASRLLGHPVRKVGVIGPQRHLSLVCSALDLGVVHAASTTGMSKKLNPYLGHDVPVCLQPTCSFKALINWLEGSGVSNVLVSLSRAQASMLCGADWVFVDARDMSGSVAHLHAGTNLIADMVRVLQGIGKLDKELTESGFLSLVASWARLNKCDHDNLVITGAKELIARGSVYGALNMCESFLFALFTAIMENQVSVSRSTLARKLGDVDISEKLVRVSKNVLQKMATLISPGVLTKELSAFNCLQKSTSAEWLISRQSWDEQYARWLTLNE